MNSLKNDNTSEGKNICSRVAAALVEKGKELALWKYIIIVTIVGSIYAIGAVKHFRLIYPLDVVANVVMILCILIIFCKIILNVLGYSVFSKITVAAAILISAIVIFLQCIVSSLLRDEYFVDMGNKSYVAVDATWHHVEIYLYESYFIFQSTDESYIIEEQSVSDRDVYLLSEWGTGEQKLIRWPMPERNRRGPEIFFVK